MLPSPTQLSNWRINFVQRSSSGRILSAGRNIAEDALGFGEQLLRPLSGSTAVTYTADFLA
jgi:hypothetical protein